METQTKALTNYDEAFAKMGQEALKNLPPPTGTFITSRAGVFKYGDNDIGQQMAVVILAYVQENNFYTTKWDPDNVVSPTCYAFGDKDDEMAPHESMQTHPEYFEPQYDQCKECPKNVMGTADFGSGKACKNRIRLAIIQAGEYIVDRRTKEEELSLIDDPEHYRTADALLLKIAPTSIKGFRDYVRMLSENHGGFHVCAFVTRIYTSPHKDHQFHVNFELIEPLKNELKEAVIARHFEAKSSIITPYTPPQERGATSQTHRGGLRR